MSSAPAIPAELWGKIPPDASALLVVFAQLEKRVAEMEQRLGINSTNSSVPPSANPPGARKPVVNKPTGRKTGGQPGHPGHSRQRLPRERIDHVIS
jgi:transposase